MFQSSPAPKGGRYKIAVSNSALMPSVSILARPEGRALHDHARRRYHLHQFQSSPAPKGGRYLSCRRAMMRDDQFQSSPAPKGGRYFFLHPYRQVVSHVSILARPEGRALRPANIRMTTC